MSDAARVEFPRIIPPSYRTAEAARQRLDALTKPPGSLGRLEEIAEFISAAQDHVPAREFQRVRVVVFSGDHGISQRGISLYPPQTSVEILRNILTGGAGINALATAGGATIRALDISLDRPEGLPGEDGEIVAETEFDADVSRFKIRRVSGCIDREDAMTPEETAAAITAGRTICDEEIDGGADLLIAGDNGIGNTSVSASLVGVMTAQEPHRVCGRGSGISDQAWMRKTEVIRDAMFRGRGLTRQPQLLLQRIGSPDLAAMAGFLAQAAVRKTPVILDGLPVGAAALMADAMASGARRWWIAGHRSAEPAHDMVLKHLGLAPLLDLSMRLGEGTGAAMALPLVTTAVHAMNAMATFTESGVSEGVDS